MKQRLTVRIREKITADLMRHRFDAEKRAIAMDRARLAAAIYEDYFSEAERELMAKLPDGWMPQTHQVRVNIAGQRHHIDFDGETLERKLLSDELSEIGLCSYRKIPKSIGGYGYLLKAYDGDHKFAAEIGRIEAEAERVRDEERKAEGKARAILNKASTFKRLLEIWPEIEPFAKPYMATPAAPVPAIPIADLNKALGLPVS